MNLEWPFLSIRLIDFDIPRAMSVRFDTVSFHIRTLTSIGSNPGRLTMIDRSILEMAIDEDQPDILIKPRDDFNGAHESICDDGNAQEKIGDHKEVNDAAKEAVKWVQVEERSPEMFTSLRHAVL